MKSLKTLAYLAAGFAYALIVFGAVVRITESGLGCGPNWPLCNGQVFPTITDYHVVIEYVHRLAAIGLLLLIVALAGTAYSQRALPGVPGKGGVLRPAMLAIALYFAQALLGAITVWLDLHATAVVLHLGTAMALLAALLVAGWRASAAENGPPAGAPRMRRAVFAAAGLTLVTILLGGLTAMTGAAPACQGFPLCNGMIWPDAGSGGLAHLHWIHRLFAYVLFGHLIGLTMGAKRRGASPVVQRWAVLALVAVVIQVAVAATMVLTHLPPSWRGLHVAAGTAVWVAVVGLAWRVSWTAETPAA